MGARLAHRQGDHKYKTRIIFDGIDYSGGDEIEGSPIVYDLPDTHRGWSEVYRPKAVPISRDIEKSVELDEESWSSYSVNASFEVTNRTTAKAEASVGEIASASVESETTISAKTEFGMDNGNRKKSTYTHTARDHDALQRVHEAGAGEQPRRGDGERHVDRQRDRARGEDRVPRPQVVAPVSRKGPEGEADHQGEVAPEIPQAQEVAHPLPAEDGDLHVELGEDPQRPLRTDEHLRVLERIQRARGRQRSGHQIQRVREANEHELPPPTGSAARGATPLGS